MKRYMIPGKAKGFSLLELVMVIGMIAALVGIAAPFYQDYVGQSRNAVMRANLQLLKKTLMEYKADKGTYPPDIETLVPQYIMEYPVDPELDAPSSWSYQLISPTEYQLNAKYSF